MTFNRSFLELKYLYECLTENENELSIGPFWNWNMSMIWGWWSEAFSFQSVLSGIEIYDFIVVRINCRYAFNRSFLELKFQELYQIGRWSPNFQSVLSGIEIAEPCGFLGHGIDSFNRSFLELKFGDREDQETGRIAFNRSFLELKCGGRSGCCLNFRYFQSVLSGIEILRLVTLTWCQPAVFQSVLSGIEIT